MVPLRLGLIGAGPWGRNFIRTISENEGFTLVRVVSKSPETPALVGKDCSVDVDWRKTMRAGDLEGVIIATPPALHAEMARAALAEGLPVLVEKPLALDVPSAEDLLQEASRRTGFVLVDHIYLFHPAYQELKRRASELGALRRIRSLGRNRGPFRRDMGPLWDYGPHDAALCLDLFGKAPEHVAASREAATGPAQEFGENLELHLRFPGSIEAELRVGNLAPRRERRFEAYFEDRALVFDDVLRTLTLHRSDAGFKLLDAGESIPFDPERPLARCLKEFGAAIRSGRCDLSSLRLGVGVVKVLSEAERSIRDRPRPNII